MNQQQQQQFDMEHVLNSNQFFWIGRGGFAVTHDGNALVRQQVVEKVPLYMATPRAQKKVIARSMLEHELANIKFVISRDCILTQLQDDDRLAADEEAMKARGETFKAATRKVGKNRRESILNLHNSIEQIASYEEGTCIEVGQKWCLDILNHLLREEANMARKLAKDLGAPCSDGAVKRSTSTGSKRKHQETSAETTTTTTTQEDEDLISSLDQVFNVPLLPDSDLYSVCEMLEVSHDMEGPKKKQKRSSEPTPIKLESCTSVGSDFFKSVDMDMDLFTEDDDLLTMALGLRSEFTESTSSMR